MNFSIKLPQYVPKRLAILLVSFLVLAVAGTPFWKMCSDEIQEWYTISKPVPSVVPDSIKTIPVKRMLAGNVDRDFPIQKKAELAN